MYKDTFPKNVKFNEQPFTLCMLDHTDRDRILILAHHLPESDLSFMRRDITQPEAVDEWIRDIDQQQAISISVEHDDAIIGYGTLYHDQRFWNRHIGEVRVLVSSNYRNLGIGTRVVRELMQFAQELSLDKVISYMSADDRGAQRMVSDLGFTAEALLADWVKTRDDRTHDLVIMSLSLRGQPL